MAALLAPTGSLWVHLDWRAAYMVRCVLDEILGREAFVNEIVWRRAPNLGRQAASHQFGRTLDTILVYAKTPGGLKLNPPTRLEPVDKSVMRWEKGREDVPFTTAPRGDYTDESIARLEKEGRVYRTPSGRVYVKYFLVKDSHGKWCRERRVDALWTDIAPLRHVPIRERTGYPTQKPRALLERIVACASPPGGLVMDLFAGSGTTGDAARVLGRRFVLGDRSELAIATARARLAREGVSPRVDACRGWRRAEAPDIGIEPREDGSLGVILRAPAEPAAWAIDADYDPARPFRSTWHSERRPGTRSIPASSQAVLSQVGDRIAVRVFTDDGGLSEAVVDVREAFQPVADARTA
jgi:site-specific DNA-methyltransferase (adenine-specific)/adenine-specific DNA-methyltransferase